MRLGHCVPDIFHVRANTTTSPTSGLSISRQEFTVVSPVDSPVHSLLLFRRFVVMVETRQNVGSVRTVHGPGFEMDVVFPLVVSDQTKGYVNDLYGTKLDWRSALILRSNDWHTEGSLREV